MAITRCLLSISHIKHLKSLNLKGNPQEIAVDAVLEVFPALKIYNYSKVDPNQKTKRGLKKLKRVEQPKPAPKAAPIMKTTGIVKVKKTNKTKMLSKSSKSKVSEIIAKQEKTLKWDDI